MIRPRAIPGLFVTSTDTGVGKTIVAAAIADHFHRRGVRVGVFKPVASDCSRRDETGRLVSEDAEMLAAVVGNRFTPELVCPQRYVEPLAPSVAARVEKRPLDWDAIQRGYDAIVNESDVLIVEGVGGVHVPLDERHTVIDLIRHLRLPAICVSRPRIGTINHTTLTVGALLAARLECAGVVVNRYPIGTAGIAEQTNVAEIDRWSGARVRCVVPEAYFAGYAIPPEIARAIDGVDWSSITRLG